MNFSGGTHTLTGATFSNAGTIDFSGGTANFDTATTIPGAVNITNTGGVNFNGATASSLTGAATLNGGTLGGSGVVSFSSLTWKSGLMVGTGGTAIPATSTLTISEDSNKFLYRTLNNYGTVTWTGAGYIRGDTSGVGGVFNNYSAAMFDARSDASLYHYGFTRGTFNNEGRFQKSVGTGTTSVQWTFNNTGTVDVQTGTLAISGAVTQLPGTTLTGGTWIARANATLNITTGSNITTNQGSVTLDWAGSTFAKINTLADNQGSFTVKGGRNFTTAGNLANSGALGVGNGSTLTVSGGLSGAGTTTVGEGGAAAGLSANYVRQATLDIKAGTTATVNPNAGPGSKAAGVSVLTDTTAPNNALKIAAGGALNLKNNDLIVYYPTGSGAATLANLQQYIYDGFLNTAGAAQIQADKTLGTYQTYAVAFDNGALTTPWSTWAGQTLSGSNQIIAKYTFRGDMDLNGVVDGNDFTVIQQNFGTTGLGPGRGWMKGDADLDGDVDGNDFTVIQANFGGGSGGALTPPVGNVVPEPSTLALALLAGLAALGVALGRFWRRR